MAVDKWLKFGELESHARKFEREVLVGRFVEESRKTRRAIARAMRWRACSPQPRANGAMRAAAAA